MNEMDGMGRWIPPAPEGTPRTQAALLDAKLKHSFPNASFVHADFARTLELELLALNMELRNARSRVAECERDMVAGWKVQEEQRDRALAAEQLLSQERAKYLDLSQSYERLDAELRQERAKYEDVEAARDTLAKALWICWLEEDVYGDYYCACCDCPANIEKLTTAEHKPDCPVLLAMSITSAIQEGK